MIRGALLLVGIGAAATAGGMLFLHHPERIEPGYQPEQPVAYSHKLHAGNLGMDCLYCHNTVDKSSYAAVPATQTCMNCHSKVRVDSPLLAPLRESWANDTPVAWTKVHMLPDYAYFDHSAHVTAGVGCESCHGRVDEMHVVTQREPLTMGWCLDCHRQPDEHLRDPALVTQMGLLEKSRKEGQPMPKSPDQRKVVPPLHCSGCHR